MKLAEIQRAFLSALTKNQAEEIRAQLTRPNDQRIEIYRTSYELRLIESLLEDFSELQSTMSGDDLRALALKFVRDHPSQSPTLYGYSAQFVQWLITQNSPWAELANREWAGLCVRQRVETAFLELSQEQILARLPEIQVQRNHASETVYQLSTQETALIWKRAGDVFEIELSHDEARLLNLIQTNPIGLIELTEQAEQIGLSPHVIQVALTEWTSEKIIGIVE